MRYEYMTQQFRNLDDAAPALNHFGQDGWRVITAWPVGQYHHAFLFEKAIPTLISQLPDSGTDKDIRDDGRHGGMEGDAI